MSRTQLTLGVAGVLSLCASASAQLSVVPGWTADGGAEGLFFGHRVASAGDVNGDGFGDVVVFAYTCDSDYDVWGCVAVYHGTASGPSATPAWSAQGDTDDGLFGFGVATAGDVNGDGYGDLIVGQYNVPGGWAYVYHGSASGLSAEPDWSVPGGGGTFGISVASAGDVNGDGYDDVIVGAPSFTNGQNLEGRVLAYYGSANGLSPVPDWIEESDLVNGSIGGCVAAAGDVNGDGFGDVIIGGYNTASIYLGSGTGLASNPFWTAWQLQTSWQFGECVSSAGDVNGDGYGDVIVGAAYLSNGQTQEGGAFVYQGSPTAISTTADWAVESNKGHSFFGWSVSTAGDVNGDGFGDVIVGAVTYTGVETQEGRAFVYHGSPSGLASSPAWFAGGGSWHAHFGNSVAAAGDVNGDGGDDVIVGAYTYNATHVNEGRAYVFYGAAPAPCPADASGDGMVDGADITMVLGSWGPCGSCPADINEDGVVDGADLTALLGAWGDCP